MLEPWMVIAFIVGVVIFGILAAKWQAVEPIAQGEQKLVELSLPYDENQSAVVKSLLEREGIQYREMPFSHPDPYRWLNPSKAYVLLVAEPDYERAEKIVNACCSSD
jgi:hypothetical protein